MTRRLCTCSRKKATLSPNRQNSPFPAKLRLSPAGPKEQKEARFSFPLLSALQGTAKLRLRPQARADPNLQHADTTHAGPHTQEHHAAAGTQGRKGPAAFIRDRRTLSGISKGQKRQRGLCAKCPATQKLKSRPFILRASIKTSGIFNLKGNDIHDRQ